ncbi:MAG: UDP-N-acetylmuramate dehydrogenase [Bacteroidetes bacterium]|jgi:UDP-N-acetylmuramate dehydrogenase|nr:UDP-N-acetylmuramate dehydrogenase [Bacteroidota bacterium]
MLSFPDLRAIYHGELRASEPMDRHTWMRVGGPAEFYCEPADRNDLAVLIRYLHEQKVPFMVVGRGSNLLVSDAGIRGAVINLETCLNEVRMEQDLVVAEAGVRLTKFVDFCVQHGLAGVEMLAGIPGTVGGAVVMNAGAHGGETSDHLVYVELLRESQSVRIEKRNAGFAYRKSGVMHDVVLSAGFRLSGGDAEALGRRRKELIMKRNQTQPLELPNLGSMFKNPAGMHAAKLIEEAGLKGKRIGNIQVSEKHANFMVNLGAAKASDVLGLIALVQQTVFERSGIKLELEVKLMGFTPEEVARVS